MSTTEQPEYHHHSLLHMPSLALIMGVLLVVVALKYYEYTQSAEPFVIQEPTRELSDATAVGVTTESHQQTILRLLTAIRDNYPEVFLEVEEKPGRWQLTGTTDQAMTEALGAFFLTEGFVEAVSSTASAAQILVRGPIVCSLAQQDTIIVIACEVRST